MVVIAFVASITSQVTTLLSPSALTLPGILFYSKILRFSSLYFQLTFIIQPVLELRCFGFLQGPRPPRLHWKLYQPSWCQRYVDFPLNESHCDVVIGECNAANGYGIQLNYTNGENGNYGRVNINCAPGAPNVTNLRFNGIVHSLSDPSLISFVGVVEHGLGWWSEYFDGGLWCRLSYQYAAQPVQFWR